MIHKLKSTLSHNLNNALGWRTNRKIIVIESDDWGSIRMPNKDTYTKLVNKGIRVDLCPYNKYDTLANSEDFKALYDQLNEYKDFNGNPPIITTNTNIANPDFEQIQKDKFENYYYENFLNTLSRYYPNENVFGLWQEGISNKFIYPQLHGREHLNVRFWMEFLNKKDINVLAAFKNKSIGINPKHNNGIGYMAAYDLIEQNHIAELNQITKEGLDIFENLFGYRSVFFTPSALIHHDDMHSELKKLGIKYIDMARSRVMPNYKGSKTKKYHYLGQTNKLGQKYITRNVMFEPNSSTNAVNNALNAIAVAFKYNKPAIISSHRVNFVGGKSIQNRENGLKDLKKLLDAIVNKWPDVEFVPIRDIFK